MKSLIKIFGKYVGLGWMIMLLLLGANLVLLLGIIIDGSSDERYKMMGSISRMEENVFSGEEGERLLITEEGERYLEEKDCEFLMVLSDDGDVIADWHLPEGFASHYTAGEIAAFSKWYLKDYPVKIWRGERGLLVAGFPRESVWKYNMEFSMSFIYNINSYASAFLLVNLAVLLLLIGWLACRFYHTLKPMAEGMDLLAQNKRAGLPEKGIASELCAKINRTSDILEEQRHSLEQRDTARTEWIAGVSHDIRTPLAIIMGYADEMEENEELNGEERKKAEIIRSQSLKIKQLIEDLNLTSKLEYHMQPLRLEEIRPAPLLRQLAAEIMNEGLAEKYELIPDISTEAENAVTQADKELLMRAVRNLLYNSMNHNPEGCHIRLECRREKNLLVLGVKDDGTGIPKEVCRILSEEGKDGKENEKKPHIMGLRIVKQIALAHNGGFRIAEEGHLVEITLHINT